VLYFLFSHPSSFVQYGGLLAVCALLLVLVKDRANFLTFAVPAIPFGRKRKVQLTTTATVVDLSTFFNCCSWINNVMIVPYERLVVFLDTCIAEHHIPQNMNKKDFILDSQEKQHSYIHSKYTNKILDNMSNFNAMFSKGVREFYDVTTKFMIDFVPSVVQTIVALQENKFYYDRGVEGAFSGNDDSNNNMVLNKIMLWHTYEEIEHNMEAVYLYKSTFGFHRFYLLPLTLPVFCILLYTIFIFGYILFVINNITHFAKIIYGTFQLLYHIFWTDVSSLWNAFLVFMGLFTTDEKVRKDLKLYADKWKVKYGSDINQDNVAL